MKALITYTVGVMLLFTTGIAAEAATAMLRMSDKSPAEFGRVVEDLGRADAIFIGDTHDDSKLHAAQLEIIRGLYAKNPQMAIGVEMFTSDYQRYLDDWSAGKLEEQEFVAIYGKNWSYDWRLYRDIFIFARDNHIPMIAVNVPKQLMSKVVRGGSKSLTEADKKELPPGVNWTLNPRQADYLRRIREQVFGNIPPRLPIANFNEAQALRNQAIAYQVAKFKEKSPKSRVAVIAGTWHAIKNGAPESMAAFGSYSYKVVLPDLAEFAWLKPTAQDADYLIPRGE